MDSPFEVEKAREIDPIINELALMKQLIKERTQPLDLLRELIANAAAREVGAKHIKVTYFVHPDYGNVFQVSDDGCGMDFTGDVSRPGRLDRFLGMGLSGIVGLSADEFSWKGLGSKLGFQSRLLEVETWTGTGKVLRAEVNEPWSTIERGARPRPKVTEWQAEAGRLPGTTVKVYGHPPHRKDRTFSFEEIENFLWHRTFVGYTRTRDRAPIVQLAALGKAADLLVGFPELRQVYVQSADDTVAVDESWGGRVPGSNKELTIHLKGFYTWDDQRFGLRDSRLNTGLIIAVNGIPYFSLNMRELGSRQIAVATPGPGKFCLIAECDQIQEDMNISRSALVDSAMTDRFRDGLRELIARLEKAQGFLDFRQVPEVRKHRRAATDLDLKKRKLSSKEQNWVFWENPSGHRIRLLREPENETDVLAILWKLEALGGLPFKQFETLGYSGAAAGPDLIVDFQEDATSEPELFKTVEVENKFYNYGGHGHLVNQYPTVICWNLGPKPKLKVQQTDKKHKFIAQLEDSLVRIYTIRHMQGIRVGSKDMLERRLQDSPYT